ncbi:hypothetical protein FPV67DRAFT_1672325 [Lyophyllum atratum]|nr:hypothetical protein FPV67DRAFT_1672325 [Lyophyllum atratum]
MNAINAAFDMEDFLRELLCYVDVHAAIAVGQLSWRGHRATHEHLKSICNSALNVYFADDGVLSKFWETLDSIQGVVCGSTCLAIFQAQANRAWEPEDLNIVVPCGMVERMATFLHTCGATCLSGNVMPARADTTRSYTIFRLPGNNRMVAVAESMTTTVLTIVLDGSSTALMNVLTGRSFTCFYPHLTGAGFAVPGFIKATSLERARHSVMGVMLMDPPGLWVLRGRCGWECGAIHRRVRGGGGIASFVWDTDASRGLRVDHAPVVWRLLGICRNPMCEFRERRQSRRLREDWV